MSRVHLVHSGAMSKHHTSTAAPKSVPLRTPTRVGYSSRRAKSNGGQSFVYTAASTNGFRYPKLSPSESGVGFWHERNSKPSV
jgi:hypothetical protein